MSNEKAQKKKLVKGRHMSAIKRDRQNEKRAARNSSIKSRVTSFEKRVLTAIQSKDKKTAPAALVAFMSEIDRAAQKGAIHAKRASRRIASLSKQISALGK